MRAFDCACGEYLEAENDERLVSKMKQHTDSAHAEEGYTEARLQRMAEDSAYDVRSDGSGGGSFAAIP